MIVLLSKLEKSALFDVVIEKSQLTGVIYVGVVWRSKARPDNWSFSNYASQIMSLINYRKHH